MNSLSRKTFITATVAGLLVINIGIIIYRAQQTPESRALSPVRMDIPEEVAPELFAKINSQVSALKQESAADSVVRLQDVGMFYWPGPPASAGGLAVTEYIPLGEYVGQADVDAVMSNRRFRKVLDDLSAMDKPAASALINRELSTALSDYLKMYAVELQRFKPQFTREALAGQTAITGPTFVIDNVAEGEVVIAGTRLKILALAWSAGLLELTECQAVVQRVAREAVRQRAELYDDAGLHPFFKSEMLKLASLYSRQLIASALLGVASDDELVKSALTAAGAEWRVRQLASFEAQLTEFDLPVQSGVTDADYSRGKRSVRFVSPLSDLRFDRLLNALHVSREEK